MSTPVNQEHIEAIQADCDARKEQMRAEMDPHEAKRHDAIESAVKAMTDLHIPFVLWADSSVPSESWHPLWWRYQRFCYDKTGRPFVEEEQRRCGSVMKEALAWFSYPVHAIVLPDSEGRPYWVFRDGKLLDVSDQEEGPPTNA